MREHFTTTKFAPESLRIIQKAVQICNRYNTQGYDLSLRQLYYQFISEDFFPNTEQSYKRLGDIVSNARLAGYIDWDMIKDRGRETTSNGHWDSPADILDAVARQFMYDSWKDQPNHVELMVEKQALEGVLEPVCRRMDIRFTANKGYSSSSALYETGKRLQSMHEDKDKDLHVIYLGDHDPSGIDMTRDVKARLELFSRCPVNVHRIALNMDQIRTYNPPPNPAKMTDSRAGDYVARFGVTSWELDALNPETLAGLVTEIVTNLRDTDIYESAMERQAAARAALTGMAEEYRAENGDESEEGE